MMQKVDGFSANETVYIGGLVYKKGYSELIPKTNSVKTSFTTVDGIRSDYFKDEDTTSLFPWFGVRKYPDGSKLIKKYIETKNFARKVGLGTGIDVSNLDLAPMVNLWVYYTEYVGSETECEVSFNAENIDLLQRVSDYYGLPFPLPKDSDFDSSEKDWECTEIYNAMNLAKYDYTTTPIFEGIFKFGQIHFVNGEATALKAYKYHNVPN